MCPASHLIWGRNGFDGDLEALAAYRVRYCLVKTVTINTTANTEFALAA